jgi:hypothetical protein
MSKLDEEQTRLLWQLADGPQKTSGATNTKPLISMEEEGLVTHVSIGGTTDLVEWTITDKGRGVLTSLSKSILRPPPEPRD